jgi:hypothetical protein
MDNRKQWTQRQDQLRKLLTSKAHYDEAINLFLEQHANVHTAAISGGEYWSLQDDVLASLNDMQVKTIPRPGANSIAWLLWHITRIEDMTINHLVLNQPQVLFSGSWETRLGVPSSDCGASMDAGEVAGLSAQINVQALKEYRAEVGRCTRTGVLRLQPDQLKEVVPTEAVQMFMEEGSISQKGLWLNEYYLNRTKGFFLTRTATSHNFIHLNEAGRARDLLAKKDG